MTVKSPLVRFLVGLGWLVGWLGLHGFLDQHGCRRAREWGLGGFCCEYFDLRRCCTGGGLRAKLLRALSAEADLHFQGLHQAAAFFRRAGMLSNQRAKKLAHLDVCFNIVRHVTQVSCEGFFREIMGEVSAQGGGKKKKEKRRKAQRGGALGGVQGRRLQQQRRRWTCLRPKEEAGQQLPQRRSQRWWCWTSSRREEEEAEEEGGVVKEEEEG